MRPCGREAEGCVLHGEHHLQVCDKVLARKHKRGREILTDDLLKGIHPAADQTLDVAVVSAHELRDVIHLTLDGDPKSSSVVCNAAQ